MRKQQGKFTKAAHGARALSLAVLASCASAVEEESLSQQRSAVSTAEACEVVPPFNPNFEPELEWEWTGSTVLPNHKQVMMTPIVAEVSGDGVPDVIFNTFAGTNYTTDGVLRAISGADGSELWTVTDSTRRVRGAASIAAGDIDGDGKVELCTIPENGTGVMCFEHDGTFKFRTGTNSTNNWGGPSLADLNGDGTVEIIDGNTVYSNTGVMKWRGSDGPGGPGSTGPLSFAADIDQDGTPEVVNDRAIYLANGTPKCVNNNIGHGLAGVGNFDADPYGEVVVVWEGRVTLMDDTCATLWTQQIPGGGAGGAPNIADFDNDGQAEIGVAGASQYVVFETNGTLRWSSPTQDLSSNRTGSSTFDFEGDGKAEVVYGDETRLRIYDGATGAVRFSVPHSSGTTYENPVIVDVDGDNNAEIVIASNNYANPGVAGIRVFRDKKDGWVNTRRIWNQHAYSVTNVNEDGTIPQHAATNWRTAGLNTFRANSQGAGTTSPFAAADLVASDVAAACDSATQGVSLTARVRNLGDAAASAGLPVAFYRGNPASGGTLLGVVQVPSVLAAGAEAWVTLQLASPPGGSAQVFAVADDNGSGASRELECREDNNAGSAQASLGCGGGSCIEVRLSDYNLFLLEDYNGGHDVVGRVAAGGDIAMEDFAVGSGLAASDTANVLVAGGNLTLTRGAVWGDAWYGAGYSSDLTVIYPRGAVSQGMPIDFATRGAQLRALSAQLSALAVNGTTTKHGWGGISLYGTDPSVNVFTVQASDFTGATLLDIQAPAGSLAVVNIHGASAAFSAFGHQFGGGIDQHGVLYNFVDATSINAQGFGFWGTVLAPYADVTFTDGSWDGGMYAKSLTGNAEGHINPLDEHVICPDVQN
ncbi:choice-of-anchor A family protein [Hyalangium gracile]|uniref:choice-of-anchor A family protein n=1 Tax=Hyalangium gracile TaxID=394092 RepID=UPI001CC98827|nr:choice-of-anchor A family protein [Hyalangium gracile]